MPIIKRKNAGFTLVELLVSLAINGILLVALLSVFSSALSSYTQANLTDRLTIQLQILNEYFTI